MLRRYYTARNKPKKLTLGELYYKLQNIYLLFRDKDYFEGKAGITETILPEDIKYKAALAIGFQPFPITKWEKNDITEDHIFDLIEFFHDYISKPSGSSFPFYDSYDDAAGQSEFRKYVNSFLCDYKIGFKLTEMGTILAIGSDGLQYILDAEIIPYDEENVDIKVRDAILKWRNRKLDFGEKKQAIREMADVFEWLKKTEILKKVLNRKDEKAIFEIANNFAIRHHDPKQMKEYDVSIWYSWMFHFYLATYHAVIRLLKKQEQS